MALIRWQPFREVESLQREMNHLFDRLAMPESCQTQLEWRKQSSRSRATNFKFCFKSRRTHQF